MSAGTLTWRERRELPRVLVIAVCVVGAGVSIVFNLAGLLRELAAGQAGENGLGQDFYNLWDAARSTPTQPIYAKAIAEFAQQPGDPIHLAQFVYPPFTALVVKPLAWIPFTTAEAVWLGVGIVCLSATTALVSRGLRGPEKLALLTVLAATAPSTWWNLQQGQMNAVLLLMMIGSAAALGARRDALAGLLVGVATAIKLYPGILLLYLAWTRRWLALGIGLATFAVATAAGFILAGSDTGQYLSIVLPNQLIPSPGYDNFGIPGVFERFLVANTFHSQVANLPALAWWGPKLCALFLFVATVALEPGGRGASPRCVVICLTAVLPLVITTAWPATAIYAMPALWLVGTSLLSPAGEVRGRWLVLTAILLLYVSPLLRGSAFPPEAAAAAIKARDPIFYIWGLDATVGVLLAWAAALLLRAELRGRGLAVSTFPAN